MNEKNNQTNQESNQTNDQRKTVVNGKVVPLHQAQAMEEQFEKQNNATGIQSQHDNSSESVQAGQVAQNQQGQMNANQQQQQINQVNVQSGQTHLDQQNVQGTETKAQQQAKQDHQSVQGSAKAKAKKDN